MISRIWNKTDSSYKKHYWN